MDATEDARRTLTHEVAARDAQLEARDAEVAAVGAQLAAAVAEGEKRKKAAAVAAALANKERESVGERVSASASATKGLQQPQRGGGLKARNPNVLLSPTKANKMALVAKKAFFAISTREMKLVEAPGGPSAASPGAGSWQVSHGCAKSGKLRSSLLFGVM
eukprot:CAMPEP_0198683858 /NCGR_PEP_ID=MMETSP1468-20131203/11305_1 /TAXON_ID=1461545 /ORGANISM="Mantoniella sp, Strain CCMP1436" /LENGTH=160 /DNA_ID=CAMNT_0044428225 /DNA_START=356 /DNA_END=838 /DNA_ORIENTATION=+